jgi:hypothetical protein
MPELWGNHYSRADLLRRVGRLEQIAGVRLFTLGDGTERGVRVLEFRTGNGFSFDVIVDRAFDIGRCEQAGKAIGWQSGAGFTGPWFYEPEGLGFLHSFGGGLLTTCGLDHTSFPAEDTAAQYHYPARPTEKYGLHGRISNRPARLVGYGERWQGDECILWAEEEILQASALAEQLLLRRRIEARVGEARLTIHDVVENIGHDPTPHMYLYHVNIGFPIVDEGAELLVPSRNITPRGDYPVDGYNILRKPSFAFVEQAFDYEPLAEQDGIVPIGIVNAARNFGVYELYRGEQLPHPLIWRNLGEGSYVVGLEPSTNRTSGRLDARARGELIELAAGEAQEYDLELGVLEGAEAVQSFARRVEALVSGGGR